MTGETKRGFLKHGLHGVVKLVEFDETGFALAAAVISETTACRHTKESVTLNLDDAMEVNAHRKDWDVFEPECSEPAHWLTEIAEAEKACQQAESELESAKSHAKVCKEAYDSRCSDMRRLVRDATNPKVLPLFDGAQA